MIDTNVHSCLGLIQNCSSTSNTSHFSEESLKKLLEIMTHVCIGPDTPIFHEGEKADKLYYIIEGSVKLSKCSDDGKDYVLFYYRQGDMLGS